MEGREGEACGGGEGGGGVGLGEEDGEGGRAWEEACWGG